MSYEKVVTLYDSADHAEAARINLEKAGFSASDISVVGKRDLADDVIALREPGLWHRLFGRDLPTMCSRFASLGSGTSCSARTSLSTRRRCSGRPSRAAAPS